MQETGRKIDVNRNRHAVVTGRGTQRSLNGVDGGVYRDWLRKPVN